MDSDSDGDLPSLSSILETLKKQRPTATFVRPQQSHIEDPAEEAIIPRSKDKARSSRLCPTSRTSSTSSIDDGTPSRSKASSSKSSATPSKQSTRSGSQSLLSAADVSARKARICRGETGGSSSNSTPSARSIGLSAMTDSTEHCPSDSITASSGCFASSMSEAQPCTTEPTIPIVVVELATTTMKSSMPDNAECAASST